MISAAAVTCLPIPVPSGKRSRSDSVMGGVFTDCGSDTTGDSIRVTGRPGQTMKFPMPSGACPFYALCGKQREIMTPH